MMNDNWFCTITYMGFVVPENKWGKMANYNIRSQFQYS